MAVLQKIRERSALTIIIIAFALFAFLVPSLFEQGGLAGSSKDVGSIDGKDISFEDFRLKVSNVEKNQQGITATAASNTVWNQEVMIALLTTQFEKLGLRVGAKHIMEVLTADQNIGQNPMFLNEAGIFDEVKFKEATKSNPELAQYVKVREKDAELNAKYQIYTNLVKAGLYTTDSEGKLQYEIESNKVSFDFVSVLFSTIKDSDVKVSDDEIIAFMKKNEKRYKAEETRAIEYVLIEDKASPEDEAEVKTKVNSLLSGSVVYNQTTGKNDTLAGFRTTKNVVEFVNSNSDIPYDSTYIPKASLPAVDADKLYSLAPGEIYGPYTFGQYYCISKSLGKKSGVNVKASHILIAYEGSQTPNAKEKRTKEEAKAAAQDILAQVNANPDSFLMLAFTKSDDSSAQRGGDLGFFGPNQMVKPFNDFVFNNGIGKVGLVETQFGFHIIKVTDKQDGIRLATIAQKIEASEATSDKVFTQATQFEMEAAEKDFAKTAAAMKLTVVPAITVGTMDEAFGALGNQRNIVRWAFEDGTDVGAVKRFEVANVGHVIVKLTKVNEAGLMTAEAVRPSVEGIIKNEKKAAIIKAKMTGASLAAIAKATGSTIQQATDVTLGNPSFQAGIGQEPKVVGTAFGLAANKISAPIEGYAGVYVVQNKTVVKAPAMKSHPTFVASLKAQRTGDVSRVVPALKENATIEDNRSKFNY